MELKLQDTKRHGKRCIVTLSEKEAAHLKEACDHVLRLHVKHCDDEDVAPIAHKSINDLILLKMLLKSYTFNKW